MAFALFFFIVFIAVALTLGIYLIYRVAYNRHANKVLSSGEKGRKWLPPFAVVLITVAVEIVLITGIAVLSFGYIFTGSVMRETGHEVIIDDYEIIKENDPGEKSLSYKILRSRIDPLNYRIVATYTGNFEHSSPYITVPDGTVVTTTSMSGSEEYIVDIAFPAKTREQVTLEFMDEVTKEVSQIILLPE